jgi:hypothetical protein
MQPAVRNVSHLSLVQLTTMTRTYVLLAFAFAICLTYAQKRVAKRDDRSCHIGSMHHCRCPRMVARHNETLDMPSIVEGCRPPISGRSPDAIADQDRFRSCLISNGVISECEIIAKYDVKHPEDNCKTACKMDSCRCGDGPPALASLTI